MGPSEDNNPTKPQALAIPKEGYFKFERGRYGPVFPKTPASYGFTIIAKVKPGKEQAIREYAGTIESAVADNPSAGEFLFTIRNQAEFAINLSRQLLSNLATRKA